MAEKNAGNTALGTAVCRNIEQYQPKELRVCNDTLSGAMIGPLYEFLLRFKGMRASVTERSGELTAAVYSAQICRTRYIDDSAAELLKGGMQQLVILGAGFDTRPYRLPGAEKLKIFEVDLPEIQLQKRKRVKKTLGRLPENVTYTPMDFEFQSLSAVLAQTGFDPQLKTLFIWEGVTQYITREAVSLVLDFIGSLKTGSVVLFTYVLRSILDKRDPNGARMMEWLAAQKVAWLFGLEPSEVSSFLKPFHLKLIEDVGITDFKKRYLDPTGRKLVLIDAEHTVQALVV